MTARPTGLAENRARRYSRNNFTLTPVATEDNSSAGDLIARVLSLHSTSLHTTIRGAIARFANICCRGQPTGLTAGGAV
jgi:hypothetical protein